ncbi:hypothetical protein NLO413_0762 [Candidatus Neoehrlichia lotoris str. RAC413]|uniref:Uncharacterized protein n=1 Tax=Candidatus Neoehrlichia procyonis str. RAC413 TaxID=1359163 RepID=A0A0F3NNT9_9RICK|nr:hypothetical protein NLO413_0762 [Candidatus Neoehrlichia lotoris str. RAC413]
MGNIIVPIIHLCITPTAPTAVTKTEIEKDKGHGLGSTR